MWRMDAGQGVSMQIHSRINGVPIKAALVSMLQRGPIPANMASDETSWPGKRIQRQGRRQKYRDPRIKICWERFLQSNKFNGRSFGCPAVPNSDVKEVIEDMKGGILFLHISPYKKIPDWFENT